VPKLAKLERRLEKAIIEILKVAASEEAPNDV